MPTDGRQADTRAAGDQRHPPASSRIGPPPRKHGWWNARREERAIAAFKIVAVVLAVGLVLGGVWIVRTMMDLFGRQRAETCAAGEDDLARTAFLAYRGGPVVNLDHLATVEQRCAAYRAEHGVAPNHHNIFVNARSD